RHARPPTDDLDAEPPRRLRRPETGDESAPPPRRRPRDPQRDPRDPGRRSAAREDYRPRDRDPRDRDLRDPYDRPRRRPNRYDSYDPAAAFDAPPPPRPRRPVADDGGISDGSHHPVSRVRYRGDTNEDDDRAEYRPRPRSQARHSVDSDRWRYDS
ncbi:MAG: hypothetical protein WBB07_19990, partial [Mycobacterium sp.]